jgi:hypothetical protein
MMNVKQQSCLGKLEFAFGCVRACSRIAGVVMLSSKMRALLITLLDLRSLNAQVIDERTAGSFSQQPWQRQDCRHPVGAPVFE